MRRAVEIFILQYFDKPLKVFVAFRNSNYIDIDIFCFMCPHLWQKLYPGCCMRPLPWLTHPVTDAVYVGHYIAMRIFRLWSSRENDPRPPRCLDPIPSFVLQPWDSRCLGFALDRNTLVWPTFVIFKAGVPVIG